VGGFPASVFTAIPVDSGSSDYYGSSVALGNIQVCTIAPKDVSL